MQAKETLKVLCRIVQTLKEVFLGRGNKSVKTKLSKFFRKASHEAPENEPKTEDPPRGSITSSGGDSESTQLIDTAPSSPPPSYEHVLAESGLGGSGGIKIDENHHYHHQLNDENGKVIVYKSSKELYRAIAAQFGITCKMSDHCRCYDCQSHYFDCEYDRDNEHEKTDGGLGAGTPMFISEVMHGTACTLL